MRFFARLLSAASIATAALAAPYAISVGEISVRRGVAAGFLAGTQVGEGTWYDTGLGACGTTNTDSDYIAAVSHSLFDTYPGYNGVDPNSNPVCGTKIKATYQGKSVTITVTDCCEDDLDFSPAAFSQLAALSVGRLDDMSWSWA